MVVRKTWSPKSYSSTYKFPLPHTPSHINSVGSKKMAPPLGISTLYCRFFLLVNLNFFLCDVSPLDCVNLLLGLPYQQDRNVVYLAKTHQYKLSKYGHTYILTAAPTPTHHTKRDQSPCPSKPMCFSLSGMPYSTKQYRTPSTTIHGSLVPRIR